MNIEQIAAIRLDKTVHKATFNELIIMAEQVSGFSIDQENEPCTRKELVGEIRRIVLEAREELEWSNDVIQA